MGSKDHASEGVDQTVQVLVDGAPVNIYDLVRFRARKLVQETTTRPLGTTSTKYDATPDGWELEMEVHENSAAAEELEDALDAAAVARQPVELSVVVTTRYTGSSSKSYLYRNCTRTAFEKSASRGEKNNIRLTLKTGEARIAV